MTDHDDDLAGIDLQMWRVPPPPVVDRSSLLVRALSPAAAPARRMRIGWILAAIVIVNAVIATLVVVLMARAPAAERAVQVAAGGGSVDAQVRDLLHRLEQEQRELEQKLAENRELRALVLELQERLRQYEQREHTVEKPRDRKTPQPRPQPQLVDPNEESALPSDGNCDEVSCVLDNYSGTCCLKYHKGTAVIPKAPDVPDSLDRSAISSAIAKAKANIAVCGARWPAKGIVKAQVRVSPDGRVANVVITAAPRAELGTCVASAIQRAKFERTVQGGSFTYPFVF